MIEFTLLNTMLMLLATPGMIAPAATATKPAINAYSMRSCPRLSFSDLLKGYCQFDQTFHVLSPSSPCNSLQR